MQTISVVIPTCNRKASLLSLLANLDCILYRPFEIIIVDGGNDALLESELNAFKNTTIHYIRSEASVCIQRNIGIRKAKGTWIFLCDDDLEVPNDYLSKIMDHVMAFPEAGAVSGLVLQKDSGRWMDQYPVTSTITLWWRYIFQLSVWGEIMCDNTLATPLISYYKKKGNHLSKAGWPVLTDFSGSFFRTPVYGLGASLVRREWLLNSPYDEVLDPNGIGDNYGVALGFPAEIYIVKNAHVFHHKVMRNRLIEPLQYYRRILALDYFTQMKNKNLVSRLWLIWSLTGNSLVFLAHFEGRMLWATLKLMTQLILGRNPYVVGKLSGARSLQPGIMDWSYPS
jgi:glycosyltransferase involved in cell wall biosynthesis